jgi:Mg-chelatase subunit ChlD
MKKRVRKSYITLPSCKELDELLHEPVKLSHLEYQKLIQQLVEKGVDSIEKFINAEERKRESAIAKRIRSLREALARQAARIRAKILGKHAELQQAIHTWEATQIRHIERMERKLISETAKLKSAPVHDIHEVILDSDLIKLLTRKTDKMVEHEKPKLYKIYMVLRRLLNMLKQLLILFVRLFIKIYHAFRRLFEKLGLLKLRAPYPERAMKKVTLALALPHLSMAFADMKDFDTRISNALLSNPEAVRVVDRELHGTRNLVQAMKLSLQRYINPKKYIERTKLALSRHIQKEVNKLRARRDRKILKLDTTRKKLQARRKAIHEHAIKKLQAAEHQLVEKLRDLNAQVDHKPQDIVKRELIRDLIDMDYLKSKGIRRGYDVQLSELEITSKLIDRFADFIFMKEIQNLPLAHHSSTPSGIKSDLGIYEKTILRSVDDISRMDIVETITKARLTHPKDRHIYESDIITRRELRSAINHVVLIFDKSGSMEENNRIEAAKRAVLALYKAVKRRDPRNIVDLVAFDTKVRVIDLVELWHSEPNGFTNTGEALLVAKMLLKNSKAERKIIYLITDGLPEAYTMNGIEYAGDTKASLEYALKAASELGKYRNLKLTLILLEPKQRVYVDAATKIVTAANGNMIITDPLKLISDMLIDYEIT